MGLAINFMNEFELIELLTRHLPTHPSVVQGPGDDCAILDLGLPDKFVLFKTDAIVEEIHFKSEAAPEKVGHKALGRCLSDIAGMAGTPLYALITLGLPRQFNALYLESIYVGLRSLAEAHHVTIVGGETTTNPDRILISVALLGTVPKDKYALRSGAKAGDAVFVTGQLGGSSLGKHLEFEPRVHEARWLTEHFSIHAMMDISDGLAGDLKHILKASNVGAELLSSAIPISQAARMQANSEAASKTPLLAALTDGEDFELLFTVASRDAVPLLDAWKTQFPKLLLSCIGRITTGRTLMIRQKDALTEITLHGYTHFEKS